MCAEDDLKEAASFNVYKYKMPLAIKNALLQTYPKSYLEEPRDDVQVKSNNNPDGYEYCWKNSYGRGVGVVPPNCRPNPRENRSILLRNVQKCRRSIFKKI